MYRSSRANISIGIILYHFPLCRLQRRATPCRTQPACRLPGQPSSVHFTARAVARKARRGGEVASRDSSLLLMRSSNPGTSGLLRWLSLLLAFAAAGAANALLPSNLTARGRPSGSSGRSEVETSEAARGSVRPPRPSSRKSSSPSPRRDIEVDAAVLGHGFELGTNGSRTYALSSEERAGLARLFNTVDHDGDGGVDPGEPPKIMNLKPYKLLA